VTFVNGAGIAEAPQRRRVAFNILRKKTCRQNSGEFRLTVGPDTLDGGLQWWTRPLHSGPQRPLQKTNRITCVTAAKYINLTVLNLFHKVQVGWNCTILVPCSRMWNFAVRSMSVLLASGGYAADLWRKFGSWKKAYRLRNSFISQRYFTVSLRYCSWISLWLQLDIPDMMYVDHVLPLERAEMTSSPTVDDQQLFSGSSYQLETLEAFVRTW